MILDSLFQAVSQASGPSLHKINMKCINFKIKMGPEAWVRRFTLPSHPRTLLSSLKTKKKS